MPVIYDIFNGGLFFNLIFFHFPRSCPLDKFVLFKSIVATAIFGAECCRSQGDHLATRHNFFSNKCNFFVSPSLLRNNYFSKLPEIKVELFISSAFFSPSSRKNKRTSYRSRDHYVRSDGDGVANMDDICLDHVCHNLAQESGCWVGRHV
jgi:hypothetical protein